jgi:hypothetical protein
MGGTKEGEQEGQWEVVTRGQGRHGEEGGHREDKKTHRLDGLNFGIGNLGKLFSPEAMCQYLLWSRIVDLASERASDNVN